MTSAVPDGWKWSDLGSYINIGRGYAFKSEDYQSKGVPIVRVTNIENDGRLSLSDSVVYLSKDSAKDYSGYELNTDDVLIVMVGATVGKLARVEPAYSGSLLNQNMWRLVVKSKSQSCQKYAYYAVQPVVDKFLSSQQGSARGFLTQKDFSLANTILPPLPEQQKIAAILSSVDDVIEKTQAQIDKLKDLKTGMMQELLSPREGSKQAEMMGYTEFKDSPVGRIPVGWNVVQFSDACKVVDSLHQTPKFSDEGLPMIRVSDIKTGKVNIASALTVNSEVFSQFTKNHKPKKGDLLMSRVGSYGICCYMDRDIELCLGQNTVVIIPQTIHYLFLFYCINSSVIQNQIEFEVAGSGYKSLSLASIRNLSVITPSHEQQVTIANSLESIDLKIEKIKKKLSSLQNSKKALMQDLLTGKVRVSI